MLVGTFPAVTTSGQQVSVRPRSVAALGLRLPDPLPTALRGAVQTPDRSRSADSSAAGTTRGYPPSRAAPNSGGSFSPGGAYHSAPEGDRNLCLPFSPELHSPRPPGTFTVVGDPAQSGTALGATRIIGRFSSFGSRSPTPVLQDPAPWGRSPVPASFCWAGR